MALPTQLSAGLAAVVLAGGALLSGATAAHAATVPTPNPPHLNSATVSGGETLVSITNPTPPAGGIVSDVFYADGKGIDYNQFTIGANPKTYGFPVAEAPVGTMITARATVCVGDPDDGTQVCAASILSQGVRAK